MIMLSFTPSMIADGFGASASARQDVVPASAATT